VLAQYRKNSSSFFFHGHFLSINESKQTNQRKQITKPLDDVEVTENTYPISDIYYGTLLTGAAMRNIRSSKSIVSSSDNLGIIAHRFVGHQANITFKLEIDHEKKKVVLCGSVPPYFKTDSLITSDLTLEWGFRE
jgi:hypothetical protein